MLGCGRQELRKLGVLNKCSHWGFHPGVCSLLNVLLAAVPESKIGTFQWLPILPTQSEENLTASDKDVTVARQP